MEVEHLFCGVVFWTTCPIMVQHDGGFNQYFVTKLQLGNALAAKDDLGIEILA